MSLAAYKLLHLLGIFLLFTALGGLTLVSAGRTGGNATTRKLGGATHGIALLLLIITGFGALARLGISNPALWPGWMWGKLVLWLVLGAAVVAIRRAPQAAALLWWVWPVLGLVAGWLAIYKPF